MLIAKEGLREMGLATLILGGLAAGASWLFWPLGMPFAVVWLWVIAFFRDPPRRRSYSPGDLCAPADGTVTEITELSDHDAIGGPAVRIGLFLSLFNVHINRMPCSGRVRALSYRAGEYLDARHPESGMRNESNSVLLDPEDGMPGPVVVRQVAGLVARRIICHAKATKRYSIGSRFGLIKFGSRTELIIPRLNSTEIKVVLGDKVKAGLTIMARQPSMDSTAHGNEALAGESAREPVSPV